jgi:hypothetical protein
MLGAGCGLAASTYTDKTDRRYSNEESTRKKSMEWQTNMGCGASLEASTSLTLDTAIDGVKDF